MDTPHAYLLLNTALYSVQYTVLYTALYTEHSIASCQIASLTFLVSWRTPPPPSCFLYTIPNPTLRTLLNLTQYTVLYTKFYTVMYTIFYTVLFTVLNPTVYKLQRDWLIWLNPQGTLPFLSLWLFSEHYSVQYIVHYTVDCTV